MGFNDNAATAEAEVTTEVQDDVAARLAAIAEAVAAKTQSMNGGTAPRKLEDGMACPIDPAERALCDSCQ